MSLTKQELIDVRECVAKDNSRKAELLTRKLTEEIGDNNEYYDVNSLLDEVVSCLQAGQLWEVIEFAEALIDNPHLKSGVN